MKFKLPAFIRRYLEYRYWRRRGYSRTKARETVRNTLGN